MQDLMKSVNECNSSGRMLTCSFSDCDLNDFVLFKKRNSSDLPKKTAVVHLGLQLDDELYPINDSPWILGPNLVISKEGEVIDPHASTYICIPGAIKEMKRIPVYKASVRH